MTSSFETQWCQLIMAIKIEQFVSVNNVLGPKLKLRLILTFRTSPPVNSSNVPDPLRSHRFDGVSGWFLRLSIFQYRSTGYQLEGM